MFAVQNPQSDYIKVTIKIKAAINICLARIMMNYEVKMSDAGAIELKRRKLLDQGETQEPGKVDTFLYER